jgi:hypothetical protein
MELFVSSISNLSDARFFSAYGIRNFGFCFDVLDPNAMTIDQAKEIISWLHEPKIIGQFGYHQTIEEIEFVDAQLPLHAVQSDQPLDIKNLPVWVKTTEGIRSPDGLFLSGDWGNESLRQAIDQKPYGIQLACSKESRVEHYADLMEILEPHLT